MMVQDNRKLSARQTKLRTDKIYPIVDHDANATEKKIRKGEIKILPNLADFKRKISPPQK